VRTAPVRGPPSAAGITEESSIELPPTSSCAASLKGKRTEGARRGRRSNGEREEKEEELVEDRPSRAI
jgi:hypothetical protein